VKRVSNILRFLRSHWFSFFMGFVGVVTVIVYVIARIKYSDLIIDVGMTYKADLIALILFLLIIFLAIYYVERQHAVSAQLARTKYALARSEEQLRNIFENANDIIFAIDEKGILTFVSPEAEDTTGFSPDELIGRHFSELLGNDSRPITAYHFRKALAGEIESVSLEVDLLTRNQQLLPMDLRATARRKEGEFTGVMGMITDISESRRMEADILRYNRALTVLSEIGDTISNSFNIDNALDESLSCVVEMIGLDSGAVYVFDEHGHEFSLQVNHGLSDKFVETTSVMRISDISAETPPLPSEVGVFEDTDQFPEYIREAIQAEGLQYVCAIPLLAGGRLVGLMSLSSHKPARLDNKEIELLQSVAQKLAIALENTRLIEELVKSHTQLEAILESMDDPVGVIDVSGEIAYVNSRLETLLGRPHGEIVGKNVVNVVLEEQEMLTDLTGTPEQMSEAVRRRLAEGSLPFEVTVMIGEDLHNFQVVITGIDSSGDTVGYVCVMHDITGYKRLNQMKSDFVAAASHQLRTPLASIVGFSETILTHFDHLSSSDIREYTEIVARQGRKLAAIVNDLLDFSRLEEGVLTLERENIFIPELAGKIMLDFKVGSPNHRFHLDFDPHFPTVYADSFKVEHVLNNLVANSVKYSPDGGTITIGGKSLHNGVEIWVSDEGIGMTPEELDNLFARFYRAPQQNVLTGPGTGLGLYIVKMLVDAHGGDVRVKSKPGQGSTFTIFLPTD